MVTKNPTSEFMSPYELRQLKPETYKKLCEKYGVRDLWDIEMERLRTEAKIVQGFNEIKNSTKTLSMTPGDIIDQINIRVKIAEKEDGTPIYIEVSMNEQSKAKIDNLIFEYGMKMYAQGFNDAMAINSKQEFDELNK